MSLCIIIYNICTDISVNLITTNICNRVSSVTGFIKHDRYIHVITTCTCTCSYQLYKCICKLLCKCLGMNLNSVLNIASQIGYCK